MYQKVSSEIVPNNI